MINIFIEKLFVYILQKCNISKILPEKKSVGVTKTYCSNKSQTVSFYLNQHEFSKKFY